MNTTTYVYTIKNVVTNKKYIGISIFDPIIRFNEHWKSRNKMPYKNRPLYIDMVAYGKEAFIVETVGKYSDKEACELEQAMIADTADTYNISAGGYGNNKIYTNAEIDNVLESYNEIKTFKGTARATGLCKETVAKIVKSNLKDIDAIKNLHKNTMKNMHNILIECTDIKGNLLYTANSYEDMALWLVDKKYIKSSATVKSIKGSIGRVVTGSRKSYLGLLFKRTDG